MLIGCATEPVVFARLDFRLTNEESRTWRRRVLAKAEWTAGCDYKGTSSRFLVVSLRAGTFEAGVLYERLYRMLGDMKNGIEECRPNPLR